MRKASHFRWYLLSALLLMACGNNTPNRHVDNDTLAKEEVVDNPSIREETVDSEVEADVRKRITAIYDHIFGQYLTTDLPFYADTCGYLSASYMKLYEQILEKDSLQEDIGFFDGDHWIMGQDWDKDLAMRIDSVQVESRSRATCYITITNCGSSERVTLPLVKEEGEWRIDDFILPALSSSEKKNMQAYLNEP